MEERYYCNQQIIKEMIKEIEEMKNTTSEKYHNKTYKKLEETLKNLNELYKEFEFQKEEKIGGGMDKMNYLIERTKLINQFNDLVKNNDGLIWYDCEISDNYNYFENGKMYYVDFDTIITCKKTVVYSAGDYNNKQIKSIIERINEEIENYKGIFKKLENESKIKNNFRNIEKVKLYLEKQGYLTKENGNYLELISVII